MGADDRGGFQPVSLDTGVGSVTPGWERKFVAVAFLVHVIDVGLDLLLAYLFLVHRQWGFFCGTASFIFISCTCSAWLSSSYQHPYGNSGMDEIDGGGVGAGLGRVRHFVLNFAQWEIFAEAQHVVFHGGDSDFFHTLRAFEALSESAPNSLVHLYALLVWAGEDDSAPVGADPLLRLSVFVSFVSVGLGMAMWEHKVQPECPPTYIAAVAVLRFLELASRTLTLAVFAGFTHPYGLWWALLVDCGVMLLLLLRHESVQFRPGVFLLPPLLLVGLEPLVWTREDHAVPSDLYYMVRVAEFVLMWIFIIQRQDAVDHGGPASASWEGSEAMGLLSTLGFYAMLPCVWRTARRYEMSRDVTDWGEDGAKEGLQGDPAYTDSEASDSGSDAPAGEKGELPPE